MIRFVPVLSVFMLMSSGALAQEQGRAGPGETYARQVCAACHAVGRGEDMSPIANAAPFQEIMDRPEMTGMAVAAWLQSEHDNMPHMVPKGEEMNDLIAYMLSLKK